MPYLDHLIQIRCQILGCLHPLEPLIWNETRANWIQLTLWNTRSQLTTSKRNTPDESPKDVMNSPLAQQLSALRWRFELIELISTAPFSSGEGALTNKLQPNGSGIIKIANGCDVTCVASVGLSLDIDLSILIQYNTYIYMHMHVLSCLTSQGPQKHPPSQKTLGFASKQPTNTLSQMLRSLFHDWWMLWVKYKFQWYEVGAVGSNCWYLLKSSNMIKYCQTGFEFALPTHWRAQKRQT